MSESPSNVRIHGKSQSRTVLGIVNAYLVMHPETTVEKLREAFPCKVAHKFAKWGEENPDPMKREGLFHVIEMKDGKRVWKATGEAVVPTTTIFEQEDETIHLSDGTEVAMESIWVVDDYLAMVDWARQYGIEIASFQKADGGFVKGSFSLEYLHGYSPVESNISRSAPLYVVAEPKSEEVSEKQSQKEVSLQPASIWPMLLCALLVLLLVVLILWLHSFCACHSIVRDKNLAPTETLSPKPENVLGDSINSGVLAQPDTSSTSVLEEQKAQVAQIQNTFNSIKFPKGKAALDDEMKSALNDLISTMKSNPVMKIRITGHSSSDGDPTYNQKLSEQRARVIVEYIKSQGVEPDRLEAEGKGSSEPVSDNPEENRRTEMTVL